MACAPERIQLYSLPTPNGVKVSIALEEMQLPYEAHLVSFQTNDQLTPEFVGTFPNNKIPAIIDPQGGRPAAGPVRVGRHPDLSGRKIRQPLPAAPAARYETLQWLMFQMGGVGPMFGQVGFFHKYGGKDFEDKRPRDRYINESKRLLGVLEQRMLGRQWIMGEQFTIADIAIWPWVRNMVEESGYDAGELVGWKNFPQLQRVLASLWRGPECKRSEHSATRLISSVPGRTNCCRNGWHCPTDGVFQRACLALSSENVLTISSRRDSGFADGMQGAIPQQ